MLPNLESLVELGRRDGVDIRPTLLRVLTDIYVQRPKHASDEERQYTELALRLIDAVDTSTKVAVANTLASYGEAPLPVVRRLARDCIEVAEPIIRYSQCLPPAELRQIAEEFGPDYARAIIAAQEIKRPSAPNGRSPAATHTSTSALAPRESRTTMHRATEVRGSASKIGAAAELCELFFSASASERRLILLNLPYVAPDALTGAASLEGPEACRRLEDAALQRKRGEFARELAQALRLSMAQGQRITEDNSGEPMVVAAKALGMPTEV